MKIPSLKCNLRVLSTVALMIMFSSNASAQHWARHSIDQSSKGADGVRLADFNRDGLLDIVTGWEQGGIVRVYRNPGPNLAKKPWPAVTVGTAPSVEDAVFVDLDCDGNLDVVSCCEGQTKQVFVHWAPKLDEYMDATKWSTDAFPMLDGTTRWMFCLPMDVDGANGIDLVVGSKNPSGQVGWLESPGSASIRDLTKWKYQKWQDAGWIMSLQSFDFDGDNDQDVLVSDRKGDQKGIYWLVNQNDKTISQKWKRQDLGGQQHECMFLDIVKHQSGKPWVVCPTRDGEMLLFLGQQPTTKIPNPLGVAAGKGAAWGDMDLDGRLDIVHTTNTSDMKTEVAGVALLLSSRKATDSTHPSKNPNWKAQAVSSSEGTKFDRIELLDLDGDGDLDVLTCEERDNLGVIWYENPIRSP